MPIKITEQIAAGLRKFTGSVVVSMPYGFAEETYGECVLSALELAVPDSRVLLTGSKGAVQRLERDVPNAVRDAGISASILVRTLHSIGRQAVKDYYPVTDLVPTKTEEIARNIFGVNSSKILERFADNMRLWGFGAIYDYGKEAESFARTEGLSASLVTDARRLIEVSTNTADVAIDFTDMLYLPCRLELPLRPLPRNVAGATFDLIIVTAPLRLVPTQIGLLRRLLSKDGRVIIFAQQSIGYWPSGNALAHYQVMFGAEILDARSMIQVTAVESFERKAIVQPKFPNGPTLPDEATVQYLNTTAGWPLDTIQQVRVAWALINQRRIVESMDPAFVNLTRRRIGIAWNSMGLQPRLRPGDVLDIPASWDPSDDEEKAEDDSIVLITRKARKIEKF